MNLESGVLQVHVEDIIPNRFQPRLNFDEQGLKELSDSIKEHGIIQPLVLRKLGDKYEIIAGERRYKAAQMAGLSTVPAVIANVDDSKSAELALVENVQRRDLTAIEEARSYKSLLDQGYLTQEQLAKRMGLSQPAVANKLRLLNLDEEVQQALLEEKISERHARTLLTLDDKAAQREWLHKIINERLTVRQLDIELKKLKESNNITGSTDEGTNEIPIVSNMPSIEDIKANAIDISQANRQNVPEPIRNEPETLETLDILPESPSPSTDTYMNEPTQGGFTTATSVPEFNIATPNSASTIISSEDLSSQQNDNKFFSFNNITSEEPIQQSSFTSASTINSNQNNFEIFDAPTMNNSFINDLSKINDNQAPTQATPMTTNEVQTTQPLNTSFELNPNNKFFTPVSDPVSEVTINRPAEPDINPMDAINKLTNNGNSNEKNTNGLELKDAIGQIRSAIENLGDNGFFIDVEEIDFESTYQITMRIHKDD